MASKKVQTEISVDINLDDFNDDDIREEYEARFGPASEFEQRDVDRLADLIGEGATDDALDLLHDMAPATLHPSTIERLVSDRQKRLV